MRKTNITMKKPRSTSLIIVQRKQQAALWISRSREGKRCLRLYLGLG